MIYKRSAPSSFSIRFSTIGALAAFAFTWFVFPLYTEGDQLIYSQVYEAFSKLNFNIISEFILYQQLIDSREPGYFIAVKIFSPFVSRVFFVSLLNSFLVFLILRWMRKNNVSLVVVFLLLGNFYLFVLMFSAERLKLGLIFCLWAFAYQGRSKFVLLSLGVLTHIQTFFIILAEYFLEVQRQIEGLLRGKWVRRGVAAFAVAGGFLVIASFLGEQITSKFSSYNARSEGVLEMLKPIIFSLMTLIYAKDEKMKAAFMQLPIVVGCFYLGSDRLAIFSYFVFMYYALNFRRGLNFGVISSSIYFAVQGWYFVDNIFSYGNGFYSGA